MTAALANLPTRTVMLLFAAYSWAASTICAAGFAHWSAAERGAALSYGLCLAWQGSAFALWLVAAGIVWALLKVFGAGARGLIAMSAAMILVAPAAAFAGAALDVVFAAGGDFSRIVARAVAKMPVAILLWTALCTAGLAAVQRDRWLDARRQAAALQEALAVAQSTARDAQPGAAPERLMVSTGRQKTPVLLTQIEWLASAGNYVVVHWDEREGLVRTPLKTLEASLDPRVFARTHRSTIVNLACVSTARPLSDGSWKLTMLSGAELAVSRAFRNEILTRLGDQSATGPKGPADQSA